MNNQTKAKKLPFIVITFLLSALSTVLVYTNFPSFHKESESQKNTPSMPKIDIYAFTKKYNIEKNKQIKLSENQQETVNTVMKSFDVFAKESNYKNYPLLNSFAKKNDLEIDSATSNDEFSYELKWKDGSDVKVLYEHYNLTNDIHQIHIYNLTQQQCKYLLDKYQTNMLISAQVNEYKQTPNGTSTADASCDDLTTKDTSVAVQLQTTGEVLSMIYHKPGLYQKINQLLTKKYEKYLEENKDDKLYFTQTIDFNDFTKGVDFSIDNQGAVYIGGLNKLECKRIMYDVQTDLKAVANPNKEGVCSNHSIIKFTLNT